MTTQDKPFELLAACALALLATTLLGCAAWGSSDQTALFTPSAVAPPESGPSGIHESGVMFNPASRLGRPEISDPPTQIELGHYQYWMSCMVCHGDRGQGLTDEWRTVLDPEDQNCWQSKCHAPNHPPEGFEIPRSSPAVMGEGALTSFKSAADLQAYLRVEMPWAFPGLFDDAEYWRLTAYLAQANQIDLPSGPLGPANGERLLWIPQLPQSHQPGRAYERFVGGLMIVCLLGVALLWRRSPMTRVPRLGRRQFLIGAGRGLLIALAALLVDQVLRFLSFQAPDAETTIANLGLPGAFNRGKLTYVESARVYVGRDARGLYAIDAVCPHLGCLVEANADGGFKCPCHGSRFDVGGDAKTGPATEPLRYLHLWLESDGQMMVDRSQSVDTTARLTF